MTTLLSSGRGAVGFRTSRGGAAGSMMGSCAFERGEGVGEGTAVAKTTISFSAVLMADAGASSFSGSIGESTVAVEDVEGKRSDPFSRSSGRGARLLLFDAIEEAEADAERAASATFLAASAFCS